MVILRGVYVKHVTLVLVAINCVLDMAAVRMLSVSATNGLDTKENSVKLPDVPDGRRIVMVMVHVT